jgi:hypothetical protein
MLLELKNTLGRTSMNASKQAIKYSYLTTMNKLLIGQLQQE